jgi:hypothetical protein
MARAHEVIKLPEGQIPPNPRGMQRGYFRGIGCRPTYRRNAINNVEHDVSKEM